VQNETQTTPYTDDVDVETTTTPWIDDADQSSKTTTSETSTETTTTTTTTTAATTTTKKTGTSSPQTGDRAMTGIVAVAGISLLAMAVACVGSRKRDED